MVRVKFRVGLVFLVLVLSWFCLGLVLVLSWSCLVLVLSWSCLGLVLILSCSYLSLVLLLCCLGACLVVLSWVCLVVLSLSLAVLAFFFLPFAVRSSPQKLMILGKRPVKDLSPQNIKYKILIIIPTRQDMAKHGKTRHDKTWQEHGKT